jgi:hypothetical protein
MQSAYVLRNIVLHSEIKLRAEGLTFMQVEALAEAEAEHPVEKYCLSVQPWHLNGAVRLP